MADFGAPQFLNAAVLVIPVLAVVVVADSFIQRDVADPLHRMWASTAAAVGLGFGIVGEVAGLQALLTGPTRQTIPVVDAGLMALAASALGPRLIELLVPWYPDVARRVTQRLLPWIIGTVGVVWSTSRAPLTYRVVVYIVLALSVLGVAVGLWVFPPTDPVASHSSQEAEPMGHSDEQNIAGSTRPSASTPPGDRDGRPARPAVAQQTKMPKRRAGWWVVASVTGIALAIVMERRRRDRRRSKQLRL